jgi:rod shape determining protein RodA
MRQWFLPACFCIFALLSVQTLSSVAPQLADRQLVFFIIGGILLYLQSKVSFTRLLEMRWPLYFAGIVVLLIPLFLFGPTRNTHRWIDLGFFTIQSSQLALPLTIFSLLSVLTTAKEYTWALLLKFFVVLGIPATLILIAPDLGSTLTYAFPILAIVVLVPFTWKHFLPLIVLAIIGSILAWDFVLEPYQRVRFMSFLNPESSDNYNAHQALITVGSGQLIGRGLGQGVQSHLRFLPERQTDFIFASFAEEYGFFGCLVLLGAYGALITYLFVEAGKTKKPAEKLFLLTVAMTFLMQASINIHMNLGLLPITGVTLPFMSSGGSSIFSLALLLGAAQSIIQSQPSKSALHIT